MLQQTTSRRISHTEGACVGSAEGSSDGTFKDTWKSYENGEVANDVNADL